MDSSTSRIDITYTLVVYILGVSAGFTETSHTIDENGNIQQVCAELSGSTQIPVSITLATQDGSATSLYYWSHLPFITDMTTYISQVRVTT